MWSHKLISNSRRTSHFSPSCVSFVLVRVFLGKIAAKCAALEVCDLFFQMVYSFWLTSESDSKPKHIERGTWSLQFTVVYFHMMRLNRF